MNKGEKAEIYFKAKLLHLKDSGDELAGIGRITQLSDDKNLEDLEWDDRYLPLLINRDFESIQECIGLEKSSSRSKTDVIINNVNYSVKSDDKPSIINHTLRPGFVRICNHLEIEIDTLDQCFEDYWEKRIKGTINEDIRNDDDESPFVHHREYFRPIINYFVFRGTGSRDSKFPAQQVLVLDYEALDNEISIYDEDTYFDSIWSKLVFSLRGGGKSKRGMPKNYPDCKNSESIGKWTRKFEGEYKGALSVRVDR